MSAPTAEKTYPCEACGQPAVEFSRDVREAEPAVGADGSAWRTYAPDGPWHARCGLHPREQRRPGQ